MVKEALQREDANVKHGDFVTMSGTSFDYVSGTIGAASITDATVSSDVAYTAGSPYAKGSTITGFNAEAIISGGMWVIGSEGVLKPAPASTQAPLGVAKATTASGAECEVLVRGPTYLEAEGTVAAGTSVAMGAGAALNCVIANGAGSGARASVITGASSGGTALVYLY